jgi:ketosteroid isomerase-like protein
MKRIYVVLVVLCLALPLSAGNAKDDLKMLSDTFVAGGAKGDAAQVASIYADDAVLMPPNMPAIKGRQAIQQFWSGLGAFNISIMPESVTSHGDVAIERGTWELTAPIKDGGNYVMTFRKQNGKWLAVNDIWNSDRAPMAPASASASQ